MKKLKTILAAALSLIILTNMAACGGKKSEAGKADDKNAAADTAAEGSDLEYVKKKGKLIVGVTEFEPMDFRKDGKWTGFDAELASLLAKKLGVEAEIQEITWETKEVELEAKSIDCIWNGLTYSDDRAKNMGMTDYYMKNKQCLVVQKKDAADIKNIEALAGKNIAAESTSAGESLILDKLKNSKYIEKTSQLDALTELVAGTVDGVVVDLIMAEYLINKPDSSFSGLEALPDVLGADEEYYSAAFRKDSDIVAEANALFKEISQDGSLEKLADKYGLSEALIK